MIANILPSGVTLNILNFKEARDQLNLKETDETARIAAVRIHVERTIKNKEWGTAIYYLMVTALCQWHLWWIKCSEFVAIWTFFLPPLVPPNEANDS